MDSPQHFWLNNHQVLGSNQLGPAVMQLGYSGGLGSKILVRNVLL